MRGGAARIIEYIMCGMAKTRRGGDEANNGHQSNSGLARGGARHFVKENQYLAWKSRDIFCMISARSKYRWWHFGRADASNINAAATASLAM